MPININILKAIFIFSLLLMPTAILLDKCRSTHQSDHTAYGAGPRLRAQK